MSPRTPHLLCMVNIEHLFTVDTPGQVRQPFQVGARDIELRGYRLQPRQLTELIRHNPATQIATRQEGTLWRQETESTAARTSDMAWPRPIVLQPFSVLSQLVRNGHGVRRQGGGRGREGGGVKPAARLT